MDWTLTIDQVAFGSFRVGIGLGSDSDSDMDPNPLSKYGGVDSAKSSSKSSNSMGGITGFAFRRLGGLEVGCGSAGRLSY